MILPIPPVARITAGRLEGDEPAGLAPVPECAGDAVAVLQQLGDRALHVDVDTDRHRALLQGADHLEAGAVADVRKTGVAVTTEVTLGDLAFLRAVEQRAPALELPDPVGRLLGVQLRHPPVVEHLAAAHGVAEVHLPVVFLPHVAHRRGDAALGHDRVRLAQQRLADDRRLRAGFVGTDGGAQPRAARTDDDDVVGMPLVLTHLWGRSCQKNLGSVNVPEATSRT